MVFAIFAFYIFKSIQTLEYAENIIMAVTPFNEEKRKVNKNSTSILADQYSDKKYSTFTPSSNWEWIQQMYWTLHAAKVVHRYKQNPKT